MTVKDLLIDVLFYLAFLGQILLISYYYARKVASQMRYVLDTYPHATHPRLYPKPIEYYEKALHNYRSKIPSNRMI